MTRARRRDYLVVGPDIHGPTIYYQCRTLKGARWVSRGMERRWSILRFVHRASDAPDLLSERNRLRQARRALAPAATGEGENT